MKKSIFFNNIFDHKKEKIFFYNSQIICHSPILFLEINYIYLSKNII